MEVPYKKSHLRLLLSMGIGLLVIAALLYWNNRREFIAVFLILGMYSLLLFGFRSGRPYLSLHTGKIRKWGIFGKTIDVSQIKKVRHISGDLVLFTEHDQMRIFTAFLDFEALRRFERKLALADTRHETLRELAGS